MNFDLDATERDLQQGIRELCAGRVLMERVRASAETGGVDRELFGELGDAGVFSLRLPEAEGGLGLGFTHAAVVYEELGRVIAPGPLVAQHLAAGVVEGAADGSVVVGAVDAAARVIPYAGALDVLLLLGGPTPSRVQLVALSTTNCTRPLDPATPVATVSEMPAGEPLSDVDPDEWRRGSDLLHAALLLGNALATTELAVGYARQREQFGRAIGSFQAVKHLCADALTRAEVARAAVYAAACHLDDPTLGDSDAAVSTAALLAGEAAHRNGRTCIQVHGGMGFTWEVDAHLFLKRAHVWIAAAGGTGRHEEQVAAALVS